MATAADLAAIAAELSEGATAPFGTYVLAADDPRSALARSVEAEVFGEVFGNSPELLAAEYARYEPATVFVCVVDHLARRVAGAMRIIVGSPRGLKTLDDLDGGAWDGPLADVLARTGLDLDPARALDITTIAVADDYRGKHSGLVALALNQTAVRLGVRIDARWFVAVLDMVVLDLYQTSFVRPWSFFTGVEPRRYLDSPLSVAVYGDVEAWCERTARVDPALHDLFVHGRGMEEAVAPADIEGAVVLAEAAGWSPPVAVDVRG